MQKNSGNGKPWLTYKQGKDVFQWVVGWLCNQLLESSVTGHLFTISPISVRIDKVVGGGSSTPFPLHVCVEGAAFIWNNTEPFSGNLLGEVLMEDGRASMH